MPLADYTPPEWQSKLKAQQANPLYALYQDFQRSGLTLEEYYRRLQQAAQPQITPPFTPPMGPPAPAPVPSNIQQLQGVAFLTPPEGVTEPEVISRQRAAFQMPARTSDVQELQATAFNIPPEILGTKEGAFAARKVMENVLKPSDVTQGLAPAQIPGLMQDISRAQAEAEGYTLETGPDGKPLWVKRPEPGGTLSGTLAGLVGKVPVVGGALTAPLLPLRGAEMVLGALRVPQELQTATEVMGAAAEATRKFVKLGAPGTYGYGEKPTLEPMKAWVTGSREEAHAAFHTEPLMNQIIGSALFDPLTYVGIGITSNVGKAERLAAATKTMQEARAAAVVRETLLGVPEVGGEFLTVEQIAARAAPLQGTSDVRRLLGISDRGQAPSLEVITKLADAEPVVPLSLGDAVLLPRTQSAIQLMLRARDEVEESTTLIRTAKATGQVARVGEPSTGLADVARKTEWILREQTQTLPTDVRIGEGGMTIGEAAAHYRAGEGYFAGGIGNEPAVFHFYDEVDAMVNHLAGYGQVKIAEAVAGKVPRTGAVLTAAAKAAQAEAQAANPEIALAAKVSRLTALKPVKETWTALARTERATILERAGLDKNLARSAWLKIAPADRAAIVQEFRRTTKGFVSGVTEAPTAAAKIVTPAEAAAEAAGVAAPTAETLTLDGAKTEFLTILKEATSKRPLISQAYHIERVKAAAQMKELRKAGLSAEETLAKMKGANVGELAPDLQAELALKGVSVAGRETLLQELITSPKLLEYESLRAQIGLNAFLDGVKVPTESVTELLERALGPDIASAIRTMTGEKGAKAWVVFQELVNAPRAFATAFDFSAALRQAILLAPAHPKAFAKSMFAMFKSISEKQAIAIDLQIRSRPTFQLSTEVGGLFHAPLSGGGKIMAGEEAFWGVGRLEKVPGVKMSERAYVTMLNKMRADVFDGWYYGAIKGGKSVTVQEVKNFSQWVNWASGRGTLGPLNKFASILSIPLFAPRFFASRAEAPFAALAAIGTPRVAASILKDQVAFVGTGLGLLALAKMGGAEVELDRRSTDWGKIKIGNTRIELWGGEQQMARVIAQALAGERKDFKGNIYPASWKTTLSRGLWEGKASPGWQMGSELWTGRTFLGDPVSWKTVAQHFAPLGLADVYDAIREWGWQGLAVAPLALLGAGAQTYLSPWQELNDVRDKSAQGRTNPKTGQPYTGIAEMQTVMGTNYALNLVGTDPAVVAAQKKADDYRKRHGGPKSFQEISIPMREAQLKDDTAYMNGDMSGIEWGASNAKRSAALVNSYAFYALMNPDVKKRQDAAAKKLGITDETDLYRLTDGQKENVDALTTAYYNLFDRYKDPLTSNISDDDWATLDDDITRFRSQLTPEQAASLDRNLGAGDSPIERVRAEDQKVMEGAGFWDAPDMAWAMPGTDPATVAEILSTSTRTWTVEEVKALNDIIKASGAKNIDEYRRIEYQRVFKETGSPLAATAALARNSVNVAVGKVQAEIRTAILNKDPNLANIAVVWGWKRSVAQDLIAPALKAMGLSLPQVNAQLISIGENPIGTEEERTAAEKEPMLPAPAPETPEGKSFVESLSVALRRAVDAAKAMVQPAPPEPTGTIAPPVPPETGTEAPAAPPIAAPATATGGGGGTATGAGKKVVETPTGATSYEGIVAERGLEAITKDIPPGESNAWDVAHALAVLGGRDLATTPAGLPPDQLKAKLAGEATWGTWIDPQTWQVVGGLGLQGKASLLPMFWTLFNAGTNSVFEKTIRKDKDVQAVLLGLSHLGNATVEQYMRAFNAIVMSFAGGLAEAEQKQSEKLDKQLVSLQKKQASQAKSAAKKAAAAGEKEAAAQAESSRWDRLVAELGNY